jgi:hypothetical protein
MSRKTLVLFVGSALITAAIAQVDTGTITGRVTDPSGSVIPNVQITVVQAATNFNFQTATNADGTYRVQSLQPGVYELTYEATGFKRLVQSNVTLRTGDVLPVDVSLDIGSTTESIKVSAESTLLETETSSTGTVIRIGDRLRKGRFSVCGRAESGFSATLPWSQRMPDLVLGPAQEPFIPTGFHTAAFRGHMQGCGAPGDDAAP